MVAPNADHAVIERAVKLDLLAVPGVATPTEAFAALKAGASGLKLFPGEALGPDVLKAWRSVLPKETPLYPVGGITPERIGPYRRAGASGFGIGSALYKPGASVEDVGARRRCSSRRGTRRVSGQRDHSRLVCRARMVSELSLKRGGA